MANDDDPAYRYNHRAPPERDRERPVDDLPEALRGTAVRHDTGNGSHAEAVDAATERRDDKSLFGSDARAGAGGAPDHGAGDPGGTLGTGGRREQDR